MYLKPSRGDLMKILLLCLLIFNPIYGMANGTFELYLGSKEIEDDRLLNTKTGKIWKKSCVAMINATGACSAHMWVPEAVRGVSSQEELKLYLKDENELADSVNKPKE